MDRVILTCNHSSPHNFEVSHTFNKFLTTTLNYTQTDDIITQMLKQNTEKKVTLPDTGKFQQDEAIRYCSDGKFPGNKMVEY